MKRKRFLAGFLAVVMCIVPVQVKAEEANTVYTFTDMNNLTVSIPASLPLSYSNGVFSGTDSVTVSGTNTATTDYYVDISVDSTSIEYTNESDSSVKANGTITFGTNGVESWNKDEVANSTSKDISVEVSSFPEVEGVYNSNISYTINVTESLIEDIYFTKTVDDSTMTCEITGLTDAGKAWVVSEVTSNSRAADVDDTTKAAGELKIPSTLVVNNKKYTVTSIGASAFKGNTDITSVTMADSVTKLGYAVFYECSNLVTCKLSDSITDWGEADVTNESTGGSTFWKCTSLATVNIPNGVSVIPRSCFGYCSALTSIEIPANNVVIGHQAFMNTGLTSISLPEGTTFSGSVAYSTALGKQFYDCSSLKSVSIPSSVTFIPLWAFTNCAALTNISIKEGIQEIGYFSFANCRALTSFDVPETCEKIYNGAFSGCTGLKSFSLPIDCNLTDMSSKSTYAQFTSCTHITSVTITKGRTGVGIAGNFDRSGSNDYRVPWCCGQNDGTVSVVFEEGITEIASGTFNSCNTIKSITIPSTVTSIAPAAFDKAYYVRDLYWNANDVTVYYNSFNAIGKDYTGTILHLGDNITSINTAVTAGSGDYSSTFYYDTCKKYINYIDWGNSQVKTIIAGQFCACDLYEIYIPNTVTKIGEFAFKKNTNLKILSVPSSVITIGKSAFYYCTALTNIYWDCYNTSYSSSTYIFPYAGNTNTIFHFGDSFQTNGVSNVPNFLFNSSSINGDGAYSLILKTVDWGTFKPTSLNDAFVMADVQELKIPESITSVGNCAFYGNSRLTTLYIPSSVTTIGKCVSGSTALTDVYYGESEAYKDTNLVIDTTGKYGTEDNSLLVNATWHYTETSTLSLRAIEEIEMTEEDGIEVIDADLLSGYPDLKVLTIAKTVKSIEANAFANNISLETVYYNGSESAWNEISIETEGNDNLFNAEIIFLEEDAEQEDTELEDTEEEVTEDTESEVTEDTESGDTEEEDTESTELEDTEDTEEDQIIENEGTNENTEVTSEEPIEEPSEEPIPEEPAADESDNEEGQPVTLELQEDATPINSDSNKSDLTSDDLVTTLKDETEIVSDDDNANSEAE